MSRLTALSTPRLIELPYPTALPTTITVCTEQVGRDLVEIDEREIGLRIDFDECQIVLVVAGNVMSAVSFAIVCGYVNLQIRSTLHHVLVRYDVTGGSMYETGAETLQRLTDFARPKPIVTEELRIEIVNGSRTVRLTTRSRIDIYHRRQNLRHSENRWLRSRIGLCETWRRHRDHQERCDRAHKHDFSDAYAQQVTRPAFRLSTCRQGVIIGD